MVRWDIGVEKGKIHWREGDYSGDREIVMERWEIVVERGRL